MKSCSTTIERCSEFMGTEPLKIQTTNGLEIYNNVQHFEECQYMVFDFRCKNSYESYHLKNSINIPIEECTIDDFINFDEHEFIIKYCTNAHQKALFKTRRRRLTILVPFENSCGELLSIIPNWFSQSASDEKQPEEMMNIDKISMKNAMLFQKLLCLEKHRHTYLCKSSMKCISERYPMICHFKGHITKR